MAVWQPRARDSLEGVEETRQRLGRQALSLTGPQWSNGRSPAGVGCLYVFKPKSDLWRTGHFNIIRSAIHTPALWVTWSVFKRCMAVEECFTIFWHVTVFVSSVTLTAYKLILQ